MHDRARHAARKVWRANAPDRGPPCIQQSALVFANLSERGAKACDHLLALTPKCASGFLRKEKLSAPPHQRTVPPEHTPGKSIRTRIPCTGRQRTRTYPKAVPVDLPGGSPSVPAPTPYRMPNAQGSLSAAIIPISKLSRTMPSFAVQRLRVRCDERRKFAIEPAQDRLAPMGRHHPPLQPT